MYGQAKNGTMLHRNDGMSYTYNDKDTTEDSPVTISMAAAYNLVSCTVTVPVNIFKRGGISKTGISNINRTVSKEGKYKLYGNITYRITRWSTFSRPVKYDSKKKKFVPTRKKFKYCGQTKKSKVEVMDDYSKFRWIAKK